MNPTLALLLMLVSALVVAGILSAGVLLFPMILGMRRVKNLEF